MNSAPGEKARGAVRCAANLNDADRALLFALAAWGQRRRLPDDEAESNGAAPDLIASLSDRLAPAWFQRLGDALELDPALAGSSDPGQALDELRRMHHGSARVEPRRVHPSWWVRALRQESPTVQRLVAASVPGPLRHAIQAGLLLDSQDLESERAAAPAVASWVLALWTERLVGGEAERPDDPPAIVVLGRLSPRAGYRLCRLAGLCKLGLAGQHQGGQLREPDRARREWLAGRLEVADTGLLELARRDVESVRSSTLPSRQHAARVGLMTVARLLADSEPFRLRWALQHWPYPIAKLIRSLMPPVSSRLASLLEWESLVLKTAWDRLTLEGRLAREWPEPPAENGSTLK